MLGTLSLLHQLNNYINTFVFYTLRMMIEISRVIPILMKLIEFV